MGTAFSGQPPVSVGVTPADTSAPAANTAAVLTFAAASGQCHVLSGVAWGYSGAPTGGSLKVEDGAGNVVWGPIPITGAGAGFFEFRPFKRGTSNTALVVTLAAGGAGVSGVVSATGHWTEAG